MQNLDVKGLIAVLVILGSFALMGVYVVRGQVPDATVVAILATPLGAVIGFYFGHINGAATALANNTAALANQALAASVARRVSDPTVVTGPAVVVNPPVNPTPAQPPPPVPGG